MTLRNRRTIFLATLFLCLLAASVSHSNGVPERPLNYVVDLADIVDDTTENRLNGYLQQLEQKTTAQLVILTIKSLEGESIEDFSIEIAHDKWKVGQKGKDNGVLFLISLNDRKYRIEVGYGLEGVLPDSLVGSLGRNILVPFFKKGDYSNGIFAATLAIANEIASDSGVKINGMPTIKPGIQQTRKDKPASLINKILGFVILFIFTGYVYQKPETLFASFSVFIHGGKNGFMGRRRRFRRRWIRWFRRRWRWWLWRRRCIRGLVVCG